MKHGDRVVFAREPTTDEERSWPSTEHYDVGEMGTVDAIDTGDNTVRVRMDRALPDGLVTWWFPRTVLGRADLPPDLSRQSVEAWLDQPSASPGTP